jgi:RNA polymerase sigma-70 factor (ECF subfamily)
LLESYHRELLNYLVRQTGCRETAADLTQESFSRVLAVQTSGTAVLDVRALLYHTARNLLIDLHRRTEVRKHETFDSLTENQQPSAPQHLQPEEALTSRQMFQAYAATIDALPPRCKEAFTLYVFEDFSQSQIAQTMGISVSMVEKHIVRGMLACKMCRQAWLDNPQTVLAKNPHPPLDR